MNVTILGTEYEVFTTDLNDPDFSDADGKCWVYDKKIGVRDKQYLAGDSDEAQNYRFKHVLLHELIHAFAEESGVSYDDDEHLTDWIARMIPKINEAYYVIMENLHDNQ